QKSRSSGNVQVQTSTQRRPIHLNRQQEPFSYRSPGSTHKLKFSNSDPELGRLLVRPGSTSRVKRFGDYTIVDVTAGQLEQLDANQLQRIQVRDDLNVIKLKRGQIDTTGPEPIVEARLRQQPAPPESLQLIQLFGPPTNDALSAIKSSGARIISYVPNNAYLA